MNTKEALEKIHFEHEYGTYESMVALLSELQKQTSIEFAEWVDDNEYRQVQFSGEEKCWLKEYASETFTTEQLFLKYIEEKRK